MTNINKNPWPGNTELPVVFIADCSSRREMKLLKGLVESNRPENRDYEIIYRPLRTTDRRQLCKGDIAASIARFGDCYLSPIRLNWIPRKQKDEGLSLRDLITGHTANPNRLQQLISSFAGGLDTGVIAGPGASAAELHRDFELRKSKGFEYPNFTDFIERSALLALEKAQRNISGARYRVPRLIDNEIIQRPAMREALQQIAESSGKDLDSLEKYARKCLHEMAATPTPIGNDIAAALGRFMFERGFDPDIDIDENEIARIQQLLKEKPVAFLFTHKSHIDGFLLIWLFHQYNLTPAHIFGGINMSLPGLGQLLRSSGAIFIRRSFGNDEVYKAVFRNYIDYLGEKRFPVMWAMEGTRSRTGKLMPPRYGLINYVASAYARDDAQDLVMMPISICYDQVPEIADYDALQAGGNKRPESASWFMEYISGLKNPHGKIHVRFGEGVPISRYIDQSQPNVDKRAIQKLAFDLAVDVNKATPVTINGLICYVLLENGHRAINFKELSSGVYALWRLAKLLDVHLSDEAKEINEECLRKRLAQLGGTGVIKIVNDGIESVYMIPHDSGRMAAYYRNGILHFFTTSAIAELALLAVRSEGKSAIEEFHAEALRLRDLLKHEFFFEGSEQFLLSMEREMDLRMHDWRKHIARGSEAARKLLHDLDPLIGHGTLRAFIEAYLVVARSLRMDTGVQDVQPKVLIDRALTLGKQRVLQQRIHCEESVSSVYFENAVKIAESLNLLQASSESPEKRQQWLNELRALTANIRMLASISEAQRLSERSHLEETLVYS